MSAYTYPHTIDNGAGGRITFLQREGDRLEVENVVTPGSGPPMHVHHLQEEALTVEQGRIGYQRPGEPAPFDAAFLARQYRSEFGMTEVPAPVQRLVFPVVVAVGRLLGKYRKYADAPEPVRR